MGSRGVSEEVLLVVNDDYSSSILCQCRICHEEEEQSTTSMETPCSCSGTLKFAHRGCIQRWCDEKGSNTCEICSQKFEPGYAAAPRKALVEVEVTIRGSLEVPRQNYEPDNTESVVIVYGDEEESDPANCSPSSSERGASCCRSVAVIFTILLLVRHFISVVAVGADQYAFNLLTVFVLRASGILLPFYVVMRIIAAIQSLQRQQQQHQQQRQLHVTS